MDPAGPWRFLPWVGQEGATGFMGSSSQSSLASLLLPKLITDKAQVRKYPPPCHQTRQAETGPQKDRIGREAGQGGKERKQADGTYLAMQHQKTSFKGRDAVVGKGQEISF